MSSMEWKYDASGLFAFLKTLKSAPVRIRNVITRHLTRLVILLQVRVAKRAGKAPFPRYTGAAAASVQTKIQVASRLNFRGEVFSSLPHMAAVEVGKSAGTVVSFDDLKTWTTIRAKRGELNVPLGMANLQKRVGGVLTSRSGNEIADNAYGRFAAIVKLNIKKRGTSKKGYHPFEKTFKSSQKAIDRAMRNMGDAIASAIGKGK